MAAPINERGNHAARLLHLSPTQAPDTYEISGLDGDEIPASGTVFHFYRDGVSLGKARLMSMAETSISEEFLVRFYPAMHTTGETLLSDRDINPGDRYKARPGTPAERSELLALGGLPTHAPASIDAGDSPQAVALTIVTDTTRKRGDVAVYTAELYPRGPDDEINLLSYLGIFVRDASGRWRVEHIQKQAGCDGCEAQPNSYSLVSFGDLRGTGNLALLFRTLGYESWGYPTYELDRAGKGTWLWPDE